MTDLEPTAPGETVLDRLTRATGARPGTAEGADLAATLEAASALVRRHVGAHPVPAPVVDQATLAAAHALWAGRTAPDGVRHFGDLGDVPVRVARDAMNRARPLLRPFLPGGFA